MDLIIREIAEKDNSRIAEIIRSVMPEYDCVGEHYSINDPEVDNMYNNYKVDKGSYYVIENQVDGIVYGGGGFAALKGGESGTCELQKMYFSKNIRGFGMGKKLLQLCLEKAKDMGFKKMYLETVFRMKEAEALYRKMGFDDIDCSLGNTGHSACDHFMMREL